MVAHKVLDVASFVLAELGPLTAMKLQKLVYYGQAWSLVLLGRPLFEDEVQAWTYGPVVYSLFEQHRGKYTVAPSELSVGDPSALCNHEAALMHGVLSHYAKLSGHELSVLTHDEAPWQDAREGAPISVRSFQPITLDAMKSYYSKQPVPFAWEPAGTHSTSRE